MSQTLPERPPLECLPHDIVDSSGKGFYVVDSESASLESRMEVLLNVNSTTLATRDGQDTFSCL